MDPSIIDELVSANQGVSPEVRSAREMVVEGNIELLRRRLTRLDAAQDALRLALLEETPKRLSYKVKEAINDILSV